MAPYITRIQAKNVYKNFSIDYTFHEGVNIIYALNGYGKTTLVHVLSNVLNQDWARFFHIDFKEIRVQFSNNEEYILNRLSDEPKANHVHHGLKVRYTEDWTAKKKYYRELYNRYYCPVNNYVVKDNSEEQALEDPVKHNAAYFPAFRSALDAFFALIADEEVRQARSLLPANFPFLPQDQTIFARQYLNQFTPKLDYDAVMQLKVSFADKFKSAKEGVNKTEGELFSNILSRLAQQTQTESSTPKALTSLYHEITQLVENSLEKDSFPVNVRVKEITSLMERSNGNSRNGADSRMLFRDAQVYKELLTDLIKIRDQADAPFNKFINSVNAFLELTNKSIERKQDDPGQIELHDHGLRRDLNALSSGERQILSMLYFASWLSDQEVVLIDEPEISLHVDWQRRLLPMLEGQLHGKQIIACTHSPIILRPYQEESQELIPTFESEQTPTQVLQPKR